MNGIYTEAELAGMDALTLCREAVSSPLGLNVRLSDGSLVEMSCYAKTGPDKGKPRPSDTEMAEMLSGPSSGKR